MQIKHKITGAVLWEKDIPDLSYADLSYAKLSYADLRNANLSYADLSYADLSYANLSYADLSYADLSYADLSYADLSYANLSYANLSYADLRNANLSYADLRNANLGREIGKITRFIGSVPRSDGYIFLGFELVAGSLGILAGCQNRTLASYRKHIKNYTSSGKQTETKAILDLLAYQLKTKWSA